ncbi:TPA: Slam-dependent surface lipoprotein [Neisseria cinerea]
MKASQLTLAILLTAAFGSAYAVEVQGDSSNTKAIKVGSSSLIPFGAGRAGIAISNAADGNYSFSVNLENGPARRIRDKYGRTPINGGNQNVNVNGAANPRYLTPSDVNPVLGWFSSEKLGQVWYEKRANNTEVFSVRQMAELSEKGLLKKAPKFGGMTFAKVPTAATNVFFGEWAPRKNGTAPENSTDLNMGSSQRTVWYVGENPARNLSNMTISKATYNVVGINNHTPGRNDFYTGQVTADFGSKAVMGGSISRDDKDTLTFKDVSINLRNGTFTSTGTTNKEGITGQFYGTNAAALAGYATRGNGVGDDVAFGGKQSSSTPK